MKKEVNMLNDRVWDMPGSKGGGVGKVSSRSMWMKARKKHFEEAANP